MRIAHILASVDEATAGPSQSVPALCSALEAIGAQVDLHTVAGWRATPGDFKPLFTPTRHRQDLAAAPILGRLCLSSELNAALRRDAPSLDVLHTHGLWLMPNIYPAWASRRSGVPLVLTPRGMLGAAPLSFSPRKKALFWRLLQKRAAEQVACFHATSDAECDEIRAFGLKAPVTVIRNGVDVPPLDTSVAPSGERTLLTLGRIHPKKGLDRLVRAWAQIETGHPDWRLRIVGPGELGHAEELAALANELGAQRLAIEDPLLGEAKTAAYRQADLFVLPTLNENFAMTVAEALAAGAPVISTKGAPWSGLEREKCGWWIDHGVEPLAAALTKAMEIPAPVLRKMGANGREWMLRDFSWERVARDMHDVYSWLARGGERPATVRVD